MAKVFDETLIEFVSKELESIKSDKERIAEEKVRIRTEINNLFKIDCLKRTDDQKEKLIFFQKYYNVMIEQYGLLCKRDIAIFQMIADIGESAMRENRQANANGISANNGMEETQAKEYEQDI